MVKNKKLLLTGISGFVGSNVLDFFLRNTDYEIFGICSWKHKGCPSRILNLDSYKEHKNRITILSHDLQFPIPEYICKQIDFVDYIINMASLSHVDDSICDPINFINNNNQLMLNMLDFAVRYRPYKFIQFSTDEVYGDRNHDEWDILIPGNPYSCSKACQESMCITYWKFKSLPIIITNSNNIIGPNQNKEKFVPKIIDKIKNGEPIDIHVCEGKPGSRWYNSVQNVAESLLFILNLHNLPVRFTESDRPDRYSLSGGEEFDNLQIAKLVAELMGKKLEYNLVNADHIRPGYDRFYPYVGHSGLAELGFVSNRIKVREELERIIKCS